MQIFMNGFRKCLKGMYNYLKNKDFSTRILRICSRDASPEQFCTVMELLFRYKFVFFYEKSVI